MSSCCYQKVLGVFVFFKKWDIWLWVRKRIRYLYEDGIKHSVPLDQHLSELGKPCDAKRWPYLCYLTQDVMCGMYSDCIGNQYSITVVKRCQSDIIMYFCMSGCSVTFGSYFKNKIAEFKVKHEKWSIICVLKQTDNISVWHQGFTEWWQMVILGKDFSIGLSHQWQILILSDHVKIFLTFLPSGLIQ